MDSMTSEEFQQRFKGVRGRGRLRGHARGEMNRTERLWSKELDIQKASGEVVWWVFEGITLKLGPDCRYTPDFFWMAANGELWIDDTKGGFIAPEGRVKIAVASEMFPFRCRIVQKKEGGGWNMKEIG